MGPTRENGYSHDTRSRFFMTSNETNANELKWLVWREHTSTRRSRTERRTSNSSKSWNLGPNIIVNKRSMTQLDHVALLIKSGKLHQVGAGSLLKTHWGAPFEFSASRAVKATSWHICDSRRLFRWYTPVVASRGSCQSNRNLLRSYCEEEQH